jgi:hypothetical protein
MSKDYWTKQAQDQARWGWSAPKYSIPQPSWQERQVRDAAFNQARNHYSNSNYSSGGKKK